jgi:hypothetical protein
MSVKKVIAKTEEELRDFDPPLPEVIIHHILALQVGSAANARVLLEMHNIHHINIHQSPSGMSAGRP